MTQTQWPLVLTPQFKRMLATLKVARSRHIARTVIGEPGSSKTMAISLYADKNPDGHMADKIRYDGGVKVV